MVCRFKSVMAVFCLVMITLHRLVNCGEIVLVWRRCSISVIVSLRMPCVDTQRPTVFRRRSPEDASPHAGDFCDVIDLAYI